MYRLQGGAIEKLTHDHSYVQELFDNGEISEDKMRTHPRKNIVTSGVIANGPSKPEFFCGEYSFKDGDKFFACSDGVWEALPIDEIQKTLSNGDVFAACSELQKRLISAEYRDNVSFVFVC